MISVIIPAYNVEAYIGVCLDSILCQTFKDIEILVVNDGSTDQTGEILNYYSDEYSNIKVIYQKNSGQSVARNKGIKAARGEYIVFVDSDDWLPSNKTLEMMYGVIRKSESDYVQGGLNFISGNRITKKYLPGKIGFLTGDSVLQAAITLDGLFTGPFAKIYSTDFIKSNSLYFIEGLVNEDTGHSIMIAAYAKKVGFINQCVCNVREREGSTSRADFKRMISTMDKIMYIVKRQLVNMGKYSSVDKIFVARYLRSMLYNLLQSAQRSAYSSFKSDWLFCMEQTDYKGNVSFVKYLSLPHRLMYSLSTHPKAFYLCFRALNKIGIKMH